MNNDGRNKRSEQGEGLVLATKESRVGGDYLFIFSVGIYFINKGIRKDSVVLMARISCTVRWVLFVQLLYIIFHSLCKKFNNFNSRAPKWPN